MARLGCSASGTALASATRHSPNELIAGGVYLWVIASTSTSAGLGAALTQSGLTAVPGSLVPSYPDPVWTAPRGQPLAVVDTTGRGRQGLDHADHQGCPVTTRQQPAGLISEQIFGARGLE